MAIYYIDPHTTTNGTGTWASPWSLSSLTRTGLASGDEIRIKGVALTSLLTATTYTATLSNQTQMTITAGGGLGADFTVGDILYFPAYGTFAKIISSTSNILSMYATYSCWPINDSTAYGGSITVRKVNRTTYPAGTTSNVYNVAAGYVNNITISDCWTSETTRVTDGSVKTLFNSSYTTSAMTAYIDNQTNGLSGYTVDLSNTCILNSNATGTGQYVNLAVLTSNSTITIGQFNSFYVTNLGGLSLGISGASTTIYNTTINITHAVCTSYLFAKTFAKSCTVNISNTYVYSLDLMWNSTDAFGGAIDVTYNLNYIFVAGSLYNVNALIYSTNTSLPGYNTINYNGLIDRLANTPIGYLFYGGIGRLQVNYHATNFSVRYNKKATLQTTITYGYNVSASIGGGQTYFITQVNTPPGWTITNDFWYVATAPLTANFPAKISRVPFTINVDSPKVPNSSLNYKYPNGATMGTNILVTYRDGTDPIEILSIYGNGVSVNTVHIYFPKITKDATVYRTSGPSLNSYLSTRASDYWTTASNSGSVYKTAKSTKPIKIPVTSGVAVTVTGYIRTNDTAYVNGDCDVALYFLETEVASQAMTTACINAWEQFSLTFTPSQTGEAYFLWDMYYANGNKSYWLDDLVIS